MTAAEVATDLPRGACEFSSDTAQLNAALATGLITIDSSRRVGWAKAFEALRRVESLEEEVRQLRDERVALRRAYSRLLGFAKNLPGPRSETSNTEFGAHAEAERTFRHDDAWDKGVSLAMQVAVDVGERDEITAQATNRQARSRDLQELRMAAEAAGHDSDVAAESAAVHRFACSCGASYSGTLRLAIEHRYDHLAAALVAGADLESYRRSRKIARMDLSDVSVWMESRAESQRYAAAFLADWCAAHPEAGHSVESLYAYLGLHLPTDPEVSS